MLAISTLMQAMPGKVEADCSLFIFEMHIYNNIWTVLVDIGAFTTNLAKLINNSIFALLRAELRVLDN